MHKFVHLSLHEKNAHIEFDRASAFYKTTLINQFWADFVNLGRHWGNFIIFRSLRFLREINIRDPR